MRDKLREKKEVKMTRRPKRSLHYRDKNGLDSDPDFDLFFPDQIGAGLGFSAGLDRN